jgi:small subunit ribosomal protein S3
MGQKVNPTGLRAGTNLKWPSRWFANKHAFGDTIGEDIKIRKFFQDSFNDAGIASVEIERDSKELRVLVFSSKKGVILGRDGSGLQKLEEKLLKILRKKAVVEVKEVAKPDVNAVVVAEQVCRQLEQRMPFRRVAKQAVQKAMESGAKGAKVLISGRLGGADMARSEFFTEGSVPLQTLRSDISYSKDRAETTYGTLGVKVWIYNGDVFKERSVSPETES